MLYNYLKTAIRNLTKYRLYTFINISGLAIGIAASLLVFIYIAHNYSQDGFHKNLDNIFIAKGEVKFGENKFSVIGMSPRLGNALDEASTEVSGFSRVYIKTALIQSDADHLFNEKHFIFADPSFLTLFSFPLKQGDPATCLEQPNFVLITERAATKYFGTDNPVGKVLTYNKVTNLTITGIIQNPPSNSSIQFEFIASFNTLSQIETEKNSYNNTDLTTGMYITYFLVDRPENVAKIETIAAKFFNSDAQETKFTFSLSPFSEVKFDLTDKIFMGVAVMILLLALINYVNLTTARATTRAKEIGIRKVSGAQRKSIIYQFYSESILSTTLAFTLAIVLLQLSAPTVFNILHLEIDNAFMISSFVIIIVCCLYVACIILGGSYPAFVLSRFKPSQTLKGKVDTLLQGVLLRKGLTVFQFTISIGLIFCSLIIQQQLEFMKNQKIGINKEQTMVLSLDKGNASAYIPIRDNLQNLSFIKHVTGASIKLFQNDGYALLLKAVKSDQDVFSNFMAVDRSFINAMGIQWAQKPQGELKGGDWILNQTAVAMLELDSLPVGQNLLVDKESKHINGVVKDFNFSSLQNKIAPMIMVILDESQIEKSTFALSGNIFITFNPTTKLDEQIAEIRKIYKSHQPDALFEYYFLDEAFDQLYKSEQRMINIFGFFTGLAIVIACMGLFGLITLATQMRIKEISIRKILGASIGNITGLLSRQFILLVCIACCIAVPIAYLLMNQWLEDFAFRIKPGILTFVLSSGLAILISCVVVSIQAIRAALENPVRSLRGE